VILQGHLDDARGPAAMAASFADTYWWVMGMGLAAIVPCVVLWRIERRTGGDTHEAIEQAELATEGAAA
jgi:hypothetical protein